MCRKLVEWSTVCISPGEVFASFWWKPLTVGLKMPISSSKPDGHCRSVSMDLDLNGFRLRTIWPENIGITI